LSPERLAARIASLTRETLLAMAVAGRKLARRDAADRVADACVALGPAR
jgi:UDP-N-acetylglucosamine:LPS N-acetylglucosamine transferase